MLYYSRIYTCSTQSFGEHSSFEFLHLISTCVWWGEASPTFQASSRPQLGILQLNSILALSTWRSHHVPQAEGCPTSLSPTPTSDTSHELRLLPVLLIPLTINWSLLQCPTTQEDIPKSRSLPELLAVFL